MCMVKDMGSILWDIRHGDRDGKIREMHMHMGTDRQTGKVRKSVVIWNNTQITFQILNLNLHCAKVL